MFGKGRSGAGSGGTTFVTITNSGNFGINTTTPSAKFEVNGQVNVITGAINFGGTGSSISTDPAIYRIAGNNFIIANNGAEQMRLSSNNNFLIGTPTDDTTNKLQVNGSAIISGALNTTGNLQIVKVTPFIKLSGYPYGNSGAGLTFEGWATTNYNWQISVATTGGAGLELLTSTAIGGASFGTVVGSFNQTTGVYTPLSDINKKKDFEISNLGLNEILNLKPTLYRMNQENNTKKHIGFIAQEVKDFIPQAFVQNDKFIGLDYQAITATLVKAIQELNEKLVRNNIN
jgi:hypothetical protein